MLNCLSLVSEMKSLYFFHKFCVICRYSKNYLNPNKVEKKLLRSKSVHGTKRQKKYEIVN